MCVRPRCPQHVQCDAGPPPPIVVPTALPMEGVAQHREQIRQHLSWGHTYLKSITRTPALPLPLHTEGSGSAPAASSRTPPPPPPPPSWAPPGGGCLALLILHVMPRMGMTGMEPPSRRSHLYEGRGDSHRMPRCPPLVPWVCISTRYGHGARASVEWGGEGPR